MSATGKHTDTSPDEEEFEEQPFISHLLELRNRLLKGVLAVLVLFLVMAPFSNHLFTWLSGPLSRDLPPGSSLISIEVVAPFFVPIKLTLVLAVFLAMPFLLYQLWAFVAPGLYRHERKMIFPLLVSSTALFYLGALFAYYVVFPIVFGFMAHTTPHGVTMMTDISKYLSFVLTMFLAFGAAFEVPVATVVLVWAGVVTPAQLSEKRPYVIVGCFVLGMFLTPPDMFSQTMLAIPMWLLFETGVFFSRHYVRPRETEAAEEAAAADPPPDDEPAGEPDDDYRPMTDEEMDSELDRADEEHGDDTGSHSDGEDRDSDRRSDDDPDRRPEDR
ncbi:MAG: twin-arginine translocase subunit TatC [Gammaproteobacteria bacterium]